METVGNYFAPKMVSFPVTTDCPMGPAQLPLVFSKVTGVTPLGPDSRLMAYNPFQVQYWELPGFPDADTSFSIDLRSTTARTNIWPKLRQGERQPLKLYGRENAWGRAAVLYEVDAHLQMLGQFGFKLHIDDVRPLSEAGRLRVEASCQSKRPRLDCDRVFY